MQIGLPRPTARPPDLSTRYVGDHFHSQCTLSIVTKTIPQTCPQDQKEENLCHHRLKLYYLVKNPILTPVSVLKKKTNQIPTISDFQTEVLFGSRMFVSSCIIFGKPSSVTPTPFPRLPSHHRTAAASWNPSHWLGTPLLPLLLHTAGGAPAVGQGDGGEEEEEGGVLGSGGGMVWLKPPSQCCLMGTPLSQARSPTAPGHYLFTDSCRLIWKERNTWRER